MNVLRLYKLQNYSLGPLQRGSAYFQISGSGRRSHWLFPEDSGSAIVPVLPKSLPRTCTQPCAVRVEKRRGVCTQMTMPYQAKTNLGSLRMRTWAKMILCLEVSLRNYQKMKKSAVKNWSWFVICRTSHVILLSYVWDWSMMMQKRNKQYFWGREGICVLVSSRDKRNLDTSKACVVFMLKS